MCFRIPDGDVTCSVARLWFWYRTVNLVVFLLLGVVWVDTIFLFDFCLLLFFVCFVCFCVVSFVLFVFCFLFVLLCFVF